MEQLKAFADLAQPDERQAFFSLFDPKIGNYRPLQAEDIYSHAADISLHDQVPESVRSHFATARNLLAYSWSYYPFNVTAELMGYVSLEFALKNRFPSHAKKPFKALLALAVKEGLVTSSGFSVGKEVRERQNTAGAENTEDSAAQDYAETLVQVIPYLRNSLAHGSPTLHMRGASSLRTCAEFINQLFPQLPSDG